VIIMELLFLLPLMLLVGLALMQFYLLVTAREELVAASRLGARVAAAGDRNDRQQVEDEVRKTVSRALGSGRLCTADVKLVWAEDLPPQQTQGETDWVRVELAIPTRRVSPDVLGWVGAALGNQKLVVAQLARRE
jgi:hypothetical protein